MKSRGKEIDLEQKEKN